MLTGVTSTTKQNIQLGAGVLLTQYSDGGVVSPDAIIGATRGGGSFTATPTFRQIEADGIPTNLKSFGVIDDYVVTLNTTLIEFKKETLELALPGAKVNTSLNVTTITADHAIADSEYKDIWWVGDTADGKKIAIKIKNALNQGGLNFTISNKGEGTFTLALIGHYDLTDLDTAPFEIKLDKTE